ncbi:tetratricopeptide repeat protein [Candidatus Poribacteria bacterium]|nr:tetratricopeptide repeat protein [Candidatus Poribacteria bacterium]
MFQPDPNDAEAYVNRGSAYAKQGLYDRAIQDYDKAISLNPNFALAYVNRGSAYAEGKQDYDHALQDYDKAIALNFALAYNNRAVAWFFKKDYDKAWADVKRYRQAGGTPNPRFIEDLRRASGRQE